MPLLRDSVLTPATAGQTPTSPIATWGSALIAALLVAGTVTIGANYLQLSSSAATGRGGDDVSSADQKARLDAFLTLNQLTLEIVPPDRAEEAVQGMGLSGADKEAALSNLTEPRGNTPDSTSSAATAKPARGARNAPVLAPTSQARPPQRLAWITLWDSDVEDGDAVRIESDGYGRTVVLAKKPVSFAIPVPQNGVVYIKGIRDGDGGGITVGLASGPAKVLLPVMSVDQTIALRVGAGQ